MGGGGFAVEGGSLYKTNTSSAIAGLCVGAVVFLLCCVTLLCSFFCNRTRRAAAAAPTGRREGGDYGGNVAAGVDEATLQALPLVLYGEAATTQACCPVCLESYGERDVLRVLPACGHLFHRECIFKWLRQRPTCPVCRTSPLPCPMTAPLADILGLLYV
ncbi:RING-H2 finger protein ATL70-like [Oryza brachyantha]|uniref:RING-H2 finger protein ATL70-like n=1 Tax=Oryza brachyantha TaxID=4533 RepID=UPI001ADB633C|nr:RING-H2 finger protein ATL70-like [Oryza brachyantha]